MAAYFMQAVTGKGKESKESWYKVTLLLQNRYSQWVTKDYFVPSKVYASCIKQGFETGAPVLAVFDGSGDKPSLKKILPDSDVDMLCLVPDDEDE